VLNYYLIPEKIPSLVAVGHLFETFLGVGRWDAGIVEMMLN